MDEVFKDPVQFSKGINLRCTLTRGLRACSDEAFYAQVERDDAIQGKEKLEVMSSGTEFHIDMDFKKPAGTMLNADDDLFPDGGEDDSDSEDVIKIIEESTEKSLLASPEYHSFEDLAKKMVDCDPGGNVKVLILEEGDGPLVPVDAEVTIHYAAYWEKAHIPFDSTLTMNGGVPMRLRLGQGRIIPGLEVGITSLRGPHARCLLLIQPAAAWGERGALPRVRPDPSLFVIALYDVRDVHAAARFNDLPSEEQAKFEVTTRTVKSLHSEAKELFNRKKYTKAIKDYQQSISVLNISQPKNENEETEVKKLKINSLLNLALCYSKINKPKYIIRMLESLDYITDIDKNCKALFYYGKANELLGKTELAIEYYNKALKLEPRNKDIGQALENLDKYLQKSAKHEKEMWQNVFSAEKKEKIIVDDDFQDGVRKLFNDLAGSDEYAKFELPSSLNKSEIDFVKKLTEEFQGLSVYEDGEGKKKKITIVKQLI